MKWGSSETRALSEPEGIMMNLQRAVLLMQKKGWCKRKDDEGRLEIYNKRKMHKKIE